MEGRDDGGGGEGGGMGIGTMLQPKCIYYSAVAMAH